MGITVDFGGTFPKVKLSDMIRSFPLLLTAAFRADAVRAVIVFVVSPLGQFISVIQALFLRDFVDAAVARDVNHVVLYALGFGLCILIPAGALIVMFSAAATLNEKTSHQFDQRVIAITGNLPGLDHHERSDYADHLTLLREAGATAAQSVSSVAMALGTVIGFIATIGLLVGVSPWLALLPVFGLFTMATSGSAASLQQKAAREMAEPNRLRTHLFGLGTVAGSFKEIRVFGLGQEIGNRHERLRLDIHQRMTSAGARGVVISIAGWALFGLAYAAALLLVAGQAIDGSVTPGEVLLALSLMASINGQVVTAVSMVAWMAITLTIVGRYRWLVEYAAHANPPRSGTSPLPEQIVDDIRLERVGFRYPGTDTDVLTDVDLTLPAGSTVAIVGDNGAGKTTLVKLLCRFYEPTVGRVTLDGMDLRDCDATEWQLAIGAAFQDFVRFELTAQENVGVGDVDHIDDAAAVQRALAAASADDVLDALPDGLHTPLGKMFTGGVELSGGQWQKLALGRAMMKQRPLLLILDEPTANLDAETEYALFQRYADAARRTATGQGGITVLVSHRFSTVRMADHIAVLEGGRVSEFGSHDELIARGGTYAELFDMQASTYR